MSEKRETRPSVQAGRAEVSARDTEIVPEFERGCHTAGWLLFVMFAFMSVWSVVA